MTVNDESAAKRAVDVVLAAVMLFLTAPLWPVIGLAIKLEDGGRVFYEQVRYGRGGVPFCLKKFRSMVPDADVEHGAFQASEEDPRITRVGSFLRKSGLDELPQILSIWKGDMSFVGPRPLAIDEIVEDNNGDRVPWDEMPGFSDRLRVRPGLTSLATIYLPRDVHPRKKFRYDLVYVRQRSLALDLRLILLSLRISFSGRWESRQRKI